MARVRLAALLFPSCLAFLPESRIHPVLSDVRFPNTKVFETFVLDRDSEPMEEEEDEANDNESDWMEAELTLRRVPSEPSPDLSPEAVALACCRSLQWVDYPTNLAGLARCFDFFTFECRKAVTARQGGSTVEQFQEYGVLSPALQPFMGANRVDIGEGTYTAARPPLRGAMVSFPVTIQSAKVLSVRYPSGIERGGVAEPPIWQFVMRLEEQRRPPNQGCWLVREVLDVRHAFAGDMGNAHVGG
jgi:hypothetical protein